MEYPFGVEISIVPENAGDCRSSVLIFRKRGEAEVEYFFRHELKVPKGTLFSLQNWAIDIPLLA